jgi:hypothetical protein
MANPLMGTPDSTAVASPVPQTQQPYVDTQVSEQQPAQVQAPTRLMPNPQGTGPTPQTESPMVSMHAAFHSLKGGDGGSPTSNLFRSILAGAMMGAAAGPGPGGFAGGFGRGAGAVQKNTERKEDIDREQKQRDLENDRQNRAESRDQQRLTMQQQLQNVNIAAMQAETASRQHQTDLQDREYHDRHNAAASALYGTLKAAGGVPPVDQALPDSLSAYDLAQQYSKNPSIRTAPTGYFRHFIDKTDASEVTWDGNKWTHPDGTAADMTDKTSMQVLDVPDEAMVKRRPMSGADLNKMSGTNSWDPKVSYQVSPNESIALYTARLQRDNEAARTASADRAATLEATRQKHDEYDAAYRQTSMENGELMKTVSDPMADQKSKDAAQSKIDANNAELKDVYQKVYPGVKLEKGAEAPKPQPTAANDPINRAFAAVQNMAPDAAEAAISGASTLSDAQKEAVRAQLKKSRTEGASATRQVLGGVASGVVKNALNIP